MALKHPYNVKEITVSISMLKKTKQSNTGSVMWQDAALVAFCQNTINRNPNELIKTVKKKKERRFFKFI